KRSLTRVLLHPEIPFLSGVLGEKAAQRQQLGEMRRSRQFECLAPGRGLLARGVDQLDAAQVHRLLLVQIEAESVELVERVQNGLAGRVDGSDRQPTFQCQTHGVPPHLRPESPNDGGQNRGELLNALENASTYFPGCLVTTAAALYVTL